jgi:hypothetical protein
MTRSARITSLDALEAMKAALWRFASAGRNALDGVEMELHRAAEWLEQRTAYWRAEVMRCEERVVHAKGQLKLRKSSAGRGGFRDCSEQELDLRRAEAALRHAQEKQQACRRWARTLPRELEECHGPARHLGCMLEGDLRQAVGFLEQKLAALEGYLAVTAAPAPPPASPQ